MAGICDYFAADSETQLLLEIQGHTVVD